MTDTKYDKLLRDFLESEAHDREKGVTKGAIYRAVARIADRQNEADQRLDRFGRRLRSLEREAERRSEQEEGPNWRADARDITGTHDLAVIKAQHDEMRADMRSDAQWWQRQRWIWAMAIVVALVVGGVTGCVAYAAAHVEVRK